MSRSSVKSDEAFKTIGEVADLFGIQHHVLRFWETKFHVIKPLKRAGGRRFYRPEDIDIIQAIHTLLYEDGYTIKGVQKLLKTHGKNYLLSQTHVDAHDTPEHMNDDYQPQAATEPQSQTINCVSHNQRQVLKDVLDELKTLRALLD